MPDLLIFIVVSAGLGALIGLIRQWGEQSDEKPGDFAGVRTHTFWAVLGCLGAFASEAHVPFALPIVLILVALLSGGITVIYSETTRNFLDDGRQLGFQRGAVECMQVVVDNDRTFDLPSYCRLEDVVFYYPPEVCDEFFSGHSSCGRLWVDP